MHSHHAHTPFPPLTALQAKALQQQDPCVICLEPIEEGADLTSLLGCEDRHHFHVRFPFFSLFSSVYIYICMRLLSVVVGWGLVGWGLWGSFLRCSTLPLLLSRPTTTTTHNYKQKQHHHQANCINSWLERNATCPTCRKGATKCVVSIISLPPVLFCPSFVSCRFVSFRFVCVYVYVCISRPARRVVCVPPASPTPFTPQKPNTPPPSNQVPLPPPHVRVPRRSRRTVRGAGGHRQDRLRGGPAAGEFLC